MFYIISFVQVFYVIFTSLFYHANESWNIAIERMERIGKNILSSLVSSLLSTCSTKLLKRCYVVYNVYIYIEVFISAELGGLLVLLEGYADSLLIFRCSTACKRG